MIFEAKSSHLKNCTIEKHKIKYTTSLYTTVGAYGTTDVHLGSIG
ncbi:hypothetical protein M23134_07781 [Microscilla marina ATCC 23134]|uniref:Uncharacterized protein n=1 Tax=Microscilla marina ATCC 23134 TaxID=313606 RepID=A1ZLC9_MICM2|nr:hypothetical protein M23134_07781 [Microscilla marina ATCC 23134]